MSNTGPDLSTLQAAEYASSLGRPTSRSYLEKHRRRGPEDGGDLGPDFWRDGRGRCWYPRDSVYAWVLAWKQQRKFREPGKAPNNLRAA